MSRPDRTEAAPYYFAYIDKVAGDDICSILEQQATDTLGVLRTIPEDRSRHRYAAGKWSIRDVVGHVNDTERLFVSRAFWFARGFDSPLPSFDQETAVSAAAADQRPWRSLQDEFAAVRTATVSFFRNLPDDAWGRRGTASGNPFTVRALAYLTAGHVIHHMAVIRDRYL